MLDMRKTLLQKQYNESQISSLINLIKCYENLFSLHEYSASFIFVHIEVQCFLLVHEYWNVSIQPIDIYR